MQAGAIITEAHLPRTPKPVSNLVENGDVATRVVTGLHKAARHNVVASSAACKLVTAQKKGTPV